MLWALGVVGAGGFGPSEACFWALPRSELAECCAERIRPTIVLWVPFAWMLGL